MSTPYTKIERAARAWGVDFYTAAARLGKCGARRRAKKRREAEALTRLRRTWAWARDFE